MRDAARGEGTGTGKKRRRTSGKEGELALMTSPSHFTPTSHLVQHPEADSVRARRDASDNGKRAAERGPREVGGALNGHGGAFVRALKRARGKKARVRVR